MGFAYLTNIPLEKAREDYIDFLEKRGFSAKTETVKTVHAAGRITAEPVYAKINAPHYAASAMDGVAIIAADSFGATETTPKVIAKENYAIGDTGDPAPNEFDAVVMVEEIINNDDGSITLHEAANPWQHIRQIGEDICAGEMILTSKTKVSPAAVGAMIAGGVTELSVIKKPVVGIIPTGDEIVPSDTVPKAGEILEFNSSIISAILSENSAEPKVYDIVKDNLEDIKNALQKACNDCDIVILNAGTSAGREDFGREAISELGECLYHGIAIKPGKPAILGAVGKVPVLGIPGYPVSAIIVIEELLNPLISHISSTAAKKKYTEAILTRQILSGLKYKEFVRVKMGYVGNILTATPLARGAGVVSSFMKADGILEIPQNTEGYKAGEKVRIRLLSDEEQLKNTLVIIGSHDPLIDELSELIHAEDSSKYLSSSHVGSMGGIMAIKRKEAHAAGCHLLDAETGKYNIPYIKKHFPQGGVRLISCVGRIQGLMTAKNNPHNASHPLFYLISFLYYVGYSLLS